MNPRSFFDRTPGFSSLPGIRDRTTLLLLLLALLAWTAGFSFWRDGGDLRNRRALAEAGGAPVRDATLYSLALGEGSTRE